MQEEYFKIAKGDNNGLDNIRQYWIEFGVKLIHESGAKLITDLLIDIINNRKEGNKRS